MALSSHQRGTLTSISAQMKTMSAEMRAFADGCAQPKAQASAPTPLGLPAQLQINQSGSWRSVLDFDMRTAPPEFLRAADQLVRLAGEKTTMRVVYCHRSDNGGTRTTNNVLMRWSRPEGWVNT
ncbi:MAG: hypothetical protein A3I16_09840 [Burkholderiales bacterium RIFCSPLOWO2_02_FULL_66_35]|nr:MAG: hypothetical protein A3I16_09840 [Burkholderiales bacterium RIFCSPLOWO2_02_FULL_66_35]